MITSIIEAKKVMGKRVEPCKQYLGLFDQGIVREKIKKCF